jgi:hypothetical protein
VDGGYTEGWTMDGGLSSGGKGTRISGAAKEGAKGKQLGRRWSFSSWFGGR